MKKRTRSWTTRVVKAERSLDVIFFFQAEDGIRDKLVTGVQTCALPILGAPGARPADAHQRAHPQGPPQGHAPTPPRRQRGAQALTPEPERTKKTDHGYHEQIGRASCRERV